jgi:signal peptidase II
LTRRPLLSLALAGAVVVADLVSKRWASVRFADGETYLIPGILGFTLRENPGAAFGTFQNAGQVVGLLAIVVSVVVVGILLRPRPRLESLGFALILGGALGNISDRIFRGEGILDGAVIDWIILWRIPTFNLADAAVNVGVALLLVHAWRTRQRSEAQAAAA